MSLALLVPVPKNVKAFVQHLKINIVSSALIMYLVYFHKKHISFYDLSYCYQAFSAHLNRRLIGELIGYTWSGVRPSSSVRRRRPQCSKIFSKTAGPIKAKFYVEPPWVGGTKVCSRHPDQMTKVAATPIYGKKSFKIFFFGTGGPISTKLGM